MKDLAIVFSTCDKYSILWDSWRYYFNKNWRIDVPKYFINEGKDCPFDDFKQIKVPIYDPDMWTKRIRIALSSVKEDNIFFLLDDLFLTEDITDLFAELYRVFLEIDADALRILNHRSKATTIETDIIIGGTPIRKLTPKSMYLISYMTNIYKKSCFLGCINRDESIWDSEIKGSRRVRKRRYNIYDYPHYDFLCNAVKQGKLTECGKKLML